MALLFLLIELRASGHRTPTGELARGGARKRPDGPAPSGTGQAQRTSALRKRGRTHRAFCNAPYARVLRARIARFSAGFGKVPAGADVAFFIGSWYQMVTI